MTVSGVHRVLDPIDVIDPVEFLQPTESTPWVQQSSSLRAIVEEASHLLPEQAPLHAFVHHNTLHAFEHLPFEDAVVEAASVLGTEPFQKESEFAKHLETGRIQPRDIEAVVADTMNGDDRPLFPGGPTRAEFRRLRLQNLFEIPRGHALRFLLVERDASALFHSSLPDRRRREILSPPSRSETGTLRDLWKHLESQAPRQSRPSCWSKRGARRRDELLEASSIDTDELVHPLLIRLCAAFLDQGIAYWSMPDRSMGFLIAVRRLYGLPMPPPDRALRGLASELRRQEQEQWTAEQTVMWALSKLDVPSENHSTYIKETLLALRGWAGMMRQLELRPDKAPVQSPPASLLEYLAVRLVLDVVAATNLLHDYFGKNSNFVALHRSDPDVEGLEGADENAQADIELVYEAFVLAQYFPICWARLKQANHAELWLQEVRDFNELERRKLLHLALERRHRSEVIDALHAYVRPTVLTPRQPTDVQAVFCIDDREESTRRHIEEAASDIRTYGYPGFFGIATFYRSIFDHKPRPLCPVSIRPKHLIEEQPTVELERSRLKSTLLLHYHVGRQTLWRGTFISLLFGPFAIFSWIAATLLRGRAGQRLGSNLTRVRTRIEYRHAETTDDGLQRGFRVDEMADIVESLLVQTGLLADGLSELVVLVGHGSSSVSNPHLAAYGCGATAGGCGGPNARVFAMMANDRDVRTKLTGRGIVIPDTSHFVGAMHDTCRDTIEWYDLASIPDRLQQTYTRLDRTFKRALARNAKERTRLFGTVPPQATISAAKCCVEARAIDGSTLWSSTLSPLS